MNRPLVSFLLLGFALACGPGKGRGKGPSSFSPCPARYELDSLVSRVAANAGLTPGNPCGFLLFLDSAARRLTSQVSRNADPARVVEELTRFVYADRGMAFDSNALNPDNSLPWRAWERQQGGCLGVSFLFLMLAERMKLPLHGVLLPGHFFVRYDDGKTKINIEPNLGGFDHPDTYYVRRYETTAKPFFDLRNLSGRESASALAYGLGTALLHEKKYEAAARLFNFALEGLPGYPEAIGNLGLALTGQGRLDSAAVVLRNAEPLFPTDERAALNLGAVYERMGRMDSARSAYRRGLDRMPGSRPLSGALQRLGGR